MTSKAYAIFLTGCLTILHPVPGIAANAWQKAQTSADQKHWSEAQIQLEIWLKQRPKHEEARFLLARVLSWQAKYDESVGLYSELLHDRPNNADYLLGLAQVHVWQNQPQNAIPLLKRALKNAPNYPTVWELLVRSLYAADQRIAAEKIQRQAAKKFPTENWQRLTPEPVIAPTSPTETAPAVMAEPIVTEPPALPPAAQERKNIVEVGGSYEKLDNNFASWNSAYFGGAHYFSQRSNVYGRATQADRFDMQDVSIMAGITHPVSERWTLNLETDESPTYQFLPQWSLLGSAHYKMDYGFGAMFSFRRANYREQHNDTGSIGLERYWGDFRLAYTLYISQLQESPDPTFSHLGQVSYFYGDRDYIGFAIGGGQSAVRLAPGRIANAETASYSLQGQHWLTPEWALVYDISLNEQGTSYTRRGAGFGLRYAF